MASAAAPLYRVATVLNAPYVMKKAGGGYKGFIVDMLDRIANSSGFTYNMFPAKDGHYGRLSEKTGLWNGVIGELVNRDADLAAADITITQSRDRVVDFSKPFMSQTVRILAKKPSQHEASLGFLLEPFADEVWLCILFALVIVALLFMLIGRFNPYEWRQVPSDKDPRGAKHSFGPRGSLMFVVSTLFLQGYRETPKSLAGRVLSVFWFIFVFFTVIAYIGGVVAFILAGEQRIVLPFDNVEDLTKQTRIQVGVVQDGSTHSMLSESNIAVYKRLTDYIRSSNSFVSSPDEGVKEVRTRGGQFVMLMESLKAEYITGMYCDMTMVGPGLFSTGLGLAMPKGSNLRDPISLAILRMREDGTLQMLKNKWWRGGGVCASSDMDNGKNGGIRMYVTVLSMRRLAAPFLILLVGAILSVLVLVGEVVFKRLRQ